MSVFEEEAQLHFHGVPSTAVDDLALARVALGLSSKNFMTSDRMVSYTLLGTPTSKKTCDTQMALAVL